MGGGGESAESAFTAMKAYLVGHDPARLEEMRFLIAIPASLYNNRTQILAALEFACLDILGQKWGVPVCDLLGGRLRDRQLPRIFSFGMQIRWRGEVEPSSNSSRMRAR
jgi:glucarate dehydratase